MLSPVNFDDQQLHPRLEERLIEVAVSRHFEQLSGEVYQVAQALILCGLPYQPSSRIKITRRATLADGSRVTMR